MFLDIGKTEDRVLAWALAIHGAFMGAVIVLAVADRLEGTPEGKARPQPPVEHGQLSGGSPSPS